MIPRRTPAKLEDEVAALPKELTQLGVNAGVQAIADHSGLCHELFSVGLDDLAACSCDGATRPQLQK